MNSKVLLVRIFLALTVGAVVVLYSLSKVYTHPGKAMAPTFPLSRVLTQPKEEQSSLHESEPSHAHYRNGTLPPFSKELPYPVLLQPASNIQKALWTSQLYQFLKSLNRSITPHVNMVFGDSDHIEIILNWLIAAHVRLNPPLHNIMVISIDQPLCDFLASKKVPVMCIAVPAESFLEHAGPKSYLQGIKTRLLVLRLINFWGYDVASYDSDAILLRNPQNLYDSYPDVQLFAGSLTGAPAVCGGSVFVKSHRSTENLWRAIHEYRGRKDDREQQLWNIALRNLGIRWSGTLNGTAPYCNTRTTWRIYEPVTIIAFPQSVFCRRCCTAEHSGEYYLIHLNCPHKQLSRKVQQIKELNGWFLLDDWKGSVNSAQEGDSWLMSIYNT